ncbi:MAG: hypothetical protein R3C56_42150, partial [Pirellulaceae bacterium]
TQIERLGLSELFDEGEPVAEPAAAGQLASTSLTSPSQGWQQQGSQQPSTQQFGREQVVPAAAVGGQPTSGNLQWPDQSASIPNLSVTGGQNSASQQSLAIQSQVGAVGEAPMAASNTRQVICIVRDSAGHDKVVTINAPPEQLLQMIQQQSQQQIK